MGVGRLLLIAAGTLFSLSCRPGAYPVDIYNEMHYQPSQRILEPERRSAPSDSVPVSGRSRDLSFAEARSVRSPVTDGPATSARGKELFKVNCAVCHGAAGDGDSHVARRFADSGAPVAPVDLRSARVRGRSEGELYWIISNGLGNMPPFRTLLTEEERWMVVGAVREVGQQ
jgi:cytochrome c5